MDADCLPAQRLAAPFHPGEMTAQERAGVRAQMEKVGAVVLRDAMPEQHRAFFPLLPTFFVGGSDDEGYLWASMLWGEPGFVQSPDPSTLRVDARLGPDDPLSGALRPGMPLGGLGLQFETRRRNRANGMVADADARGFRFNILQSFGNCPKYIQKRELLVPVPAASPSHAVTGGSVLPDSAVALIRGCDTFFVATSAAANGPAHGADVSHRGGRSGFVDVDASGVIRWPDFQGNNFFNTIGNLTADARAGLLFIDFERGDLLHLSGRAEVVWEGGEVARFAGANRLLRFVPERHVYRRGSLPLRWASVEQSPYLHATGIWRDLASG